MSALRSQPADDRQASLGKQYLIMGGDQERYGTQPYSQLIQRFISNNGAVHHSAACLV